MKFLPFSLLLLLSYLTQAQGVDTVYFDYNGEVTTKDVAFIYSVITRSENDTSSYAVNTFFRSGGRLELGTYKATRFPVAWGKLHQPGFTDALRDGAFREYHESGALKFEGAYREGRGEGAHRRWYENGELLSEATLVDGNFEGEVVSYHENGQKKVDYSAKEGLADGELMEYQKDGKKKEKATFRKGEQVGETVLYDAEGNEILP